MDTDTSWIDVAVADLRPLSTAKELLPVLRCSRRTLSKLVAEKRLKPVQHERVRGSALLFPRAEVRRYLLELADAA